MFKKGIWIAVFAVVVSLITPGMKADAEKTFTDVPEDFWAADAIYRFAEAGIIDGYEDDSFGASDELTRSHAAIILVNALDLEMPDADEVTDYFNDVKPGDQYADYIAAAGKAEVLNGNDGAFMPNKKLTRQQMASVLVSAYSLESGEKSVDVNLSNVSSSHQDNVQVLADLGITNQLDDFHPTENISRAGFAVMLAKSIDNSKDVTELLKEAYANEQEQDSYEFEGSANLGLTVPESMKSTPEEEMMAMMLEDIQVDISGSYQQDPMLMDASVDVTMKGDMQTTVSIPMIMSEEKMWMKFPQMPGAPLPEELDGKFIEFDLQELQEMEGQPTVDTDVQTELALAIQNLFIDQFGNDYYDQAEAGSYDVPENVNAKQVLHFELTDEELQPFMETMLTGFMPKFLEILEEPEYAEALGLTEEEIKQAQEEFATIKEDIDEITSEIDDALQINTFEEYMAINYQNYIVHDAVELDVDVTAEEETFGFKLSADQTKQNINGDISIDIPDADETISMEELEDLEPTESVEPVEPTV
ncbi:S-layer homology domain-containing protein [Lentibacillus cibarius]|uniref:S-layer homology domain-containing protein n=1 Tax=Lentibacillus cibarius TaxID=2583219 RepID=A0A5S3QIN9_9BACI|nr:S-layer homology domain-containing protein [Lentibacillus cibarius]TMN21784.1 S-layer homology domain-containing protein [Lentibacillus cibarius]